jgi:glycosyltransferase involved in cell wall biosynthesis
MFNKIVYVITKPEIGGAQKWIKEQKELLSNRFDVYLITSEPGWLSEQFANDHVFFVRDILSIKSFTASYKISKILREINASVVINNSANAGIHGRLAKIYYNHRSIYVSHGWSCIYNGGRLSKVYCLIEKMLSYLTDNVLCVSKTDFVKAVNQIGISERKLVTITNGIIPLPSLEENCCLGGQLKLAYVGRMIHPKRPDLLLEVISQYPSINIDLIGDGPLLSMLKSQFNSYDNINFLGEVKNFEDFYKYDAFVLTSDSEGLPMSALEAASVGLPLLLSNVGGCSELIDKKKPNGILYNNDFNSLFSAIELLSRNYPVYRRNAYEYRGKFNLYSKYDEYVSLIKGQ